MPYIPVADREQPSNGYTPVSERLKKLASDTGGILKDTALEVAKAPVRVAMTGADVLSEAVTGKALPPLDVPGIGEVKSYGRKQEEDIKSGQDPVVAGLRNAGQGILDVAGVAAPFLAKAPAPQVIAKAQDATAATEVGNHLKTGQQVFDSMSQSQREAMQNALIEHTKTNIVDGVKGRYPQISDAVSKLNPVDFKNYDAFTGAVDKIVKGLSAGALVPIPKEDEQKFIKTMNDNGTITVEKKKSILDRIKNLDLSSEFSTHDVRKTQVATMLDAIAYNESRGEKNAYATTTAAGNKKGNTALGKYQVTTDELKTYGERFLGKAVKAAEFLKSPELQRQYMEKKIAFLIDEGLTPGEILASHRRGLPGWGDQQKLDEKRQKSKQYISDGVTKYLTDLKAKDPVAYEDQLRMYQDKTSK